MAKENAKELCEIVAILYGEAANDPEGWVPKLNTYWKAKKGDESLADVMKRVSSAYRTKSDQYQKARDLVLNDYERNVYKNILNTIKTFEPDEKWNYPHHENPDFYGGDEAKMMQHLMKQWGGGVDYENRVKIGKEFYFPLKVKHGIHTLKR